MRCRHDRPQEEIDVRRRIVIGNWKMHGFRESLSELDSLSRKLSAGEPPACEVMLCPPATLIASFADRAAGGPVRIGAQDCHAKPDGAFTGDISAEMLADAGAAAVIVGHSERRTLRGETDEMVCAKARAAHRAGLTAIICVGESEAERDAGSTGHVLKTQIRGSVPEGSTAANTIVAYEPVWAIGTGRTPQPGEIAETHDAIRVRLVQQLGTEAEDLRVLYGGSVKPDNAASLMSVQGVDGALVGGASLHCADFFAIVSACPRAAAA
ncbi:MAG: triose-phosphate isomerase [Alphaproteobacteria bacterium]